MTIQALQIVPSGGAIRRAVGAAWLSAASVAAVLAPVAVEARGAPESFADLAEQVSPAVVNITTTTMIETPGNGGPMMPEGSPFEDFFDDFNDGGRGEQGPQRANALGSGFVISEDGYIVTNNHVIEGADEIQIEFYSGKTLDAKLVGTDPNTDIALLKVESEVPLSYVNFGDSDGMRVGDWVMAMGNPLGQGFSVSAGIISARNRELQGAYDDFIQTDAAINRGNSGGPLFNMDGEVIGVNTAILSPTGGSIGIGFSMASNVVDKVTDQLREFGETRRGWLGVKIQDVTPDVAESLGLAEAAGALVSDVPEGPARDAGVKAGDIIVSLDGAPVADSHELVRRVADAEVGKALPLTVLRNGDRIDLDITIGRREEAEAETLPAKAEADEPVAKDMLGMTLGTLTDDMRQQLDLPAGFEGLIVSDVDQSSEAFEKGLRPGDIITEAGQSPVNSLEDFEAKVADAREAGRQSVLVLIRRDGEPRFVALSVE